MLSQFSSSTMSVAGACCAARQLLALLTPQAAPVAAASNIDTSTCSSVLQLHTHSHQLQQKQHQHQLQQNQQHQQQYGVHTLSMSEAQEGDTKPLNLCNAVNEALHQAMDSNDK
jgi:hypothetical protein